MFIDSEKKVLVKRMHDGDAEKMEIMEKKLKSDKNGKKN